MFIGSCAQVNVPENVFVYVSVMKTSYFIEQFYRIDTENAMSRHGPHIWGPRSDLVISDFVLY